MEFTPTYSASARAVSLIQEAFSWMFGGLMVTAVTAFAAASDMEFQRALATNPILFWGLIICEFGLVIWLGAGVTRMSRPVAIGAFVLYAALNGVTLSLLALVYSGASIGGAFVATSLVFGIMALYGYATKSDLSSVGSIAFMGLIGVILATVVNFFLHSGPIAIVISYITIVVFCALTAYDTQKLKTMAMQMSGESLGIYGALALYLDFINIFLAILRIFGGGNRR